MNLKWISINEKLKQGVKLINSLPIATFQTVFSQIINSKTNSPLADEELQNIKLKLKLNEDSFQLLMQSLLHIFKQSSKVILKPSNLYKELTEILGFDEDKAEEFVKVWCSKTNEDFGDLSNRLKLNNLTWEFNIQVADQINTKQSVPTTRMQFELVKSENPNEREKVVMEFDQTELLQLYNTLEKIQVKLDNINKC